MIARYPFHRSLVLWGALLVMAFTGWAWVDSRGMESDVRWGRMAAGSMRNGIAVMWNSRGRAAGMEAGRFKASDPLPGGVAPPPFFVRGRSAPAPAEKPRTFKEVITEAMWDQPPETWYLFIPYWMVIVATAVVAVGLIAWRAGRWRRWQRMQVEGITREAVE